MPVPELPAGALADPRFLAAIREELRRFAMLQLRNPEEAEDAVQEALVGALKNAGSFRGEAALRTWVFAILRNKLADVLRQRQRAPANAGEFDGALDQDGMPSAFDQRGKWRENDEPSRWDHPEKALHDRQFLAVFDACLGRLPPQQGQVFMMREVVELETREICEQLGLSAGNVHVILHRARIGLRACLEHNWINPGAGPC
ncbi:MAG: RNA polymerase subunit sigma [Erythrobacter sp. RIFCSPHIGHO2_12_FULL_63_10]|nr:MAG: RNA polymerase subunit sigma [Erythrobacter sp. RIFCSPHIGHO2_12_FULL_63_10]